ncbi:two-component system sensor histidine kinase NtrB [Thiohalorhabdus sp. Cl-TMA]|uniref:histidine kinase n=1 Tax=Thiohalorhabdus methylotrophus TaxID=3242694 RepID=A0ABV4TS97_9GAMM
MLSGWTPSLATLRRAVLYRTGLGFLLAALTVGWGQFPPFTQFSIVDLAAALAIEVVVGSWVLYRLRVGGHPLRLAGALVGGDFLAATHLVWFSGPIDGPLVFLYPLAVVSSSFLLGPGVSYYSAAAAFLLQGAGYLAVGGPEPDAAIRGLLLQGLLLVALAALSDGLTSRLHRHEQRAQRRERDVRTLTALADQVLERVDNGLLVVEDQGGIRFTNPQADQFLYPAPAAELDFLNIRAPELFRHFQSWQAGSGPGSGELRGVSPRGDSDHPHVLAFRFTPLGSPEGTATLINLYDLTEARQRQHTQELTERLAALGRLSANLAHEIRNPLSSIQHAGQLLAESGADGRMTGIIQRETKRLNQWVETLLRHLRPPSGQARELEVAPLVESTVRLLGNEGCMPEQGCFEWEVSEGLTVCADEGHLQQILWNLGINAIRHGKIPERGGGLIRGRVASPGRARLEVLDRGPGIPGTSRETVFEPFYTTATQGTGLGLGLVRELVEANRGTISIADRPGGGTCIAVDLPSHCSKRGKG